LEEEGGDEKEWWEKDGEEGYTSECDCVDWDWDDEVQEREIGYTGKKRCNRKYTGQRGRGGCWR
jgi:hypothetical protein